MSKSTAGGAGGAVGRRNARATFVEIPSGTDEFAGRTKAASLGADLADDWAQTLTEGEQKAIRAYKGSGYTNINASLRYGSGLSADNAAAVDNLTTALARGSLPQNVVTWRATDHPAFEAAIMDGNPSVMVGRTFQDKGFTSTSLNPGTARDIAEFNGSPLIFKVKIPKGAQAQYIDHNLTAGIHKSETEVLLNRGHSFKVSRYLGTMNYTGGTGKAHLYELDLLGRQP